MHDITSKFHIGIHVEQNVQYHVDFKEVFLVIAFTIWYSVFVEDESFKDKYGEGMNHLNV